MLRAAQVISFKNTTLLKRGVWLSALTLMAYAAAPSIASGALWREPVISSVPIFILAGFWTYVLRKSAFQRAADQVVDCGDRLEIRKGRTDEVVWFANIATVEVTTHLRVHSITIRTRAPTRLGDRIEFLPQASLWGNLAAIQRTAAQLETRARQAGSRDP
jgi:hypothetical protein